MSFRNWLDKNKVFFETVTAVLLAIMAIVVSLEANRIASYQAELMKLEHLPILLFDSECVFDPIEGKYTDELLRISNEGPPLTEFNYRAMVFFRVEYGRKGDELKTAAIPLNAYYYVTVLTNNPRGELAILKGNHWKGVQTSWTFTEFANARNAYGFADIDRYIWVSYKDILGEIHSEVFFVDPIRGGYRLSEEEGKKIFEEYEDKFKENRILEFSEVSPNSLYEKWSIIVKESKE